MNEKQLCDIYLDYFNNFLSTDSYASYYDIPENLASELINHAREIYNLTYNN